MCTFLVYALFLTCRALGFLTCHCFLFSVNPGALSLQILLSGHILFLEAHVLVMEIIRKHMHNEDRQWQ